MTNTESKVLRFSHTDTGYCRVYVTYKDNLYCFQDGSNEDKPPTLYVVNAFDGFQEPDYPVCVSDDMELDLKGCEYLTSAIQTAFDEGHYYCSKQLASRVKSGGDL